MLPLRLILFVLTFIAGLLIIDGEMPGLPKVLKGNGQRMNDFAGPIENFVIPERKSNKKWIDYLGWDKHKETYTFTNYNWYHFEIDLVDLGYDSWIEVRVFTVDQGPTHLKESVGFKLSKALFSNEGINIERNGLRLHMTQRTMSLNESRHDGLLYGRPWFFTANHSLDGAYHGQLVVTTFDLHINSVKASLELYGMHVVRKEDCISTVEEGGALRHKCFGGYGEGRAFLNREVEGKERSTQGQRVTNVFNIDANRTRTTFEGVRATKTFNINAGKKIISTQWHWKEIKAMMTCFSKPEYYEKEDNIEKERTIGAHFAITADNIHQNYLILNGKIHPVPHAKYLIDVDNLKEKLHVFESTESPAFRMEFLVFDRKHSVVNEWVQKSETLRLYGYWSGWAQDPIDNKTIDFYNITGVITASHGFY